MDIKPNIHKVSPWEEVFSFLTDKRLLTAFSLVLLIRFIFVLSPPLVTSDLMRGLWYGKQFWGLFFDVYNLSPADIDLSSYTSIVVDPINGEAPWPRNTYDYGIVSLLFYAFLALFPGGLATQVLVAKLVLTGIDALNFVLIRRLENSGRFSRNLFSWLYWIVLSLFTSLEGQVVAVTVFLFLLSLWFYLDLNKTSSALLVVAVGFHWKYVSFLLLPFLLLDLVSQAIRTQETLRAQLEYLAKVLVLPLSVFGLFWFPLLFSDYILAYISYAGALPVNVDHPWNPFYLGPPLTIASLFLLLMLVGFLGWWGGKYYKGKASLQELVSALPLFGLWLFLLVYRYAFPWYWMWSFPLAVVFPDWQKREVSVVYLGLCALAAAEFMFWTIGY